MPATVLVVEDDHTLRKNIRTYLTRKGYAVDVAASGNEGLSRIDNSRPDIALVDLMLPDMSGIEWLMRIRASDPDITVIIMTGAGSVQGAVEAMKAGAHDYLSKPLVLKELKLLLDRAIKTRNQESALSYYHGREAEQSGIKKILGESPAINEIKHRITQFVAAEKQLSDQEPPAVLITGETGCGKELVARAFHFDGPRHDQPFVELNCASIPGHLLEAELFGYERGAFTDAKQRKIGLVDAANGGTLFLDEIGEMEPGLQAKLLTLIENRRVRRLGSVHEHDVNVRIVAATNQDLDECVRQGAFRKDLYFRLRVIHIHVPPLRERGQDIRLLTDAFLTLHANRYRKTNVTINDEAVQRLMAYDWPGNVRELRNTLERAVLLADEVGVIGPEHLMISATETITTTAEGMDGGSLNIQENEIELVRRALAQTGGNVTQAASLLGLSRDTLRYRLSKYGISQA